MRLFLSRGNLVWASLLAAPATLLAIGRMAAGGKPLLLYLPILFLCMLYISGAITAWGRSAGMSGVLTDRRTLLQGCGLAVILALLSLPIHMFWIDPVVRTILPTSVIDMVFPATFVGRLSLLFWSAGVTTMFFSAAPMAVAARLSGRRDVALGCSLIVRAYVAHRIATSMGVTNYSSILICLAVISTAATCMLFARFGLVPAIVFNACLDLPVFFPQGLPS